MDPSVSSSGHSVTEYSAQQGSSGFSKEHLPGMNAAILLLALKQGTRSLEGYIAEYLALANGSELPDCMLIDFFCDGLNQPLKSKVSQVKSQLIVMSPIKSPLIFMNPVKPQLIIQSQVTSQRIFQNLVTSLLIFQSHISAAHPESRHVSADHPKSRHVTADHPKSRQVTADHPETCDVLSVTPRYSRSVLRYPSLVSSVKDAPLVSAHAAGIPKPIHSSPPVPELIPLSKVLPIMGIAFLVCLGCIHHHRTLRGGSVHYDVSRGGG